MFLKVFNYIVFKGTWNSFSIYFLFLFLFPGVSHLTKTFVDQGEWTAVQQVKRAGKTVAPQQFFSRKKKEEKKNSLISWSCGGGKGGEGFPWADRGGEKNSNSLCRVQFLRWRRGGGRDLEIEVKGKFSWERFKNLRIFLHFPLNILHNQIRLFYLV